MDYSLRADSPRSLFATSFRSPLPTLSEQAPATHSPSLLGVYDTAPSSFDMSSSADEAYAGPSSGAGGGRGPAPGRAGEAPHAGPSRTLSGRAKGPPLRSTTMDDAFYSGPGEPSALTRGKATMGQQGHGGAANGQWGAIGQAYPPQSPRAAGLYSQGNHSSPSLALGNSLPSHDPIPPLPAGAASRISDAASSSASSSGFSPFDVPDLPAMPTTMDDLNIGLESMRFEQQSPPPGAASSARHSGTDAYGVPAHSGGGDPYGSAPQRYSPNDFALPGAGGPDGAMEIRNRGGGTASVYSVDSGQGHGAPLSAAAAGTVRGAGGGGGQGWPGHGRSGSGASSRTFGGGYVDGYSEVDHARPESSASYLPYDDPYGGQLPPQQQQQQQHPQSDYYPAPGLSTSAGSVPAGYYPPGSGAEGGHYGGGAPAGYGPAGAYGGAFAAPPGGAPYGGQPQFQPAPGHGGYGYDYRAAAAAANPYYAAATGQLGLDPAAAAAAGGAGPYGALHRGTSSASSIGLAPPPPQGSVHSLSRSQSSLNIPGGPMRRKATGASTLSTASGASSSSGPPITKASVDEYRQRIKADPDPEAQFNFAKYLIEAAKKINSSASGDEKAAKKYRDALLAESLKLIKRLATQGGGLGKPAYADAQFFLANCLGNGSLGLQIDHEKAYNLYVQASKQNHSAATYRTAVCNELGAGTRRDHARAVLFYRKASALGDTAGMYKLGMILLHGLLGQQRNPKEALAWLKRAASQADEDNPHALHELGLLYEKPPALVSSTTASLGAKAAAQLQQQHLQAGGPPPTIVPFDPVQAREYFTQAAQLGYPPSQFKLGSCYEFGTLTCPVDPRRSIAWYTRAAERGDSGAELALSGWYLTGSEGVLKQSDSEAYLWARRAANKGLPKAEYAVGYYSEVGIGVKADLEEAKRWYMRAAAQGNKRAMQRLTELKKLGADKRGMAGAKGKGQSRPTRKDAETECVVM